MVQVHSIRPVMLNTSNSINFKQVGREILERRTELLIGALALSVLTIFVQRRMHANAQKTFYDSQRAVQAQSNNFEKQVTELTKQVATHQNTASFLKTQLADKDQEIEQKEITSNQLHTDLVSARLVIDNLQKQLEDMGTDEDGTSFAAIFKQKDEAITDLEKDVTELRKELGNTTLQLEDANKAIEIQNEENIQLSNLASEQLREQSVEFERVRNELQDKADLLKSQLEDASRRLCEAIEEKQAVEDALIEANKELDEYKKALVTLDNELKGLVKSSEEQLELKEEKILSLQEDLRSLRQAKDTSPVLDESQLQSFNERINELETQIFDLRLELEESKTNLEESRKNYRILETEKNLQINDLEEQVHNLEEQVHNLGERLRISKEEQDALTGEGSKDDSSTGSAQKKKPKKKSDPNS